MWPLGSLTPVEHPSLARLLNCISLLSFKSLTKDCVLCKPLLLFGKNKISGSSLQKQILLQGS